MDSILIGETITVVSEHGQTEHMRHTAKPCTDAIYRHLNTRDTQQAFYVYVFDRSNKSARRLENVRIENGVMRWDHAIDIEYKSKEN